VKVIGVGLGRTGTNSLKEALEQLGFGPCYHMFNVVEQPYRIRHWQAAVDGRPVDWDEVFAGYESVLDFPSAVFWRDIVRHYPDAPVILTVRDPERWYESAARTIFSKAIAAQHRRLPGRLAFGALTRLSPDFGAFTRMVGASVIGRLFGGRVGDRDHAIEVFNRHIKDVIAEVPAERLLVYDVAEGWAPLCEFLGVPAPVGRPFPRGNDAASFHQDEGRRMRRLVLRSMLRRRPSQAGAVRRAT
jgi:sulfotransferase family protein